MFQKFISTVRFLDFSANQRGVNALRKKTDDGSMHRFMKGWQQRVFNLMRSKAPFFHIFDHSRQVLIFGVIGDFSEKI